MVWFDGLDLPLMVTLESIFFENHPDLKQPVRGHDLSEQLYGAGGRALRHDERSAQFAAARFRWKHTERQLEKLLAHSAARWRASSSSTRPPAARDPDHGCVMTASPRSAHADAAKDGQLGPRRLPRHRAERDRRAPCSSWGPGDIFVVPSWAAVDHEADTTADIFEVSDEATVRALRLFRDETVEQHQEITGVFEPRRLVTG